MFNASDDVAFLSQKQANGQHLLDKICEKLNLLEKEYFSCTYAKSDVKVMSWSADISTLNVSSLSSFVREMFAIYNHFDVLS